MVIRSSRRRTLLLSLVVTLGIAGSMIAFAAPVNAAPPVYVVVGDDPNATGDQWGFHESYYSELRAVITNPANFGASGKVNAVFTIGAARALPLGTNSLDGVDVYFLAARTLDPAEVTVLSAFIRRGGAVVANSNAPGFFDDTDWLGFSLSPRVVYGDGAAPYTTTHRAPSPSAVDAAQIAHPAVNGPFGTVATFENWHSVAGFIASPAKATELAHTTLTGPDDNGSTNFITLANVATLAVIPAGGFGTGSGPVVATSDVDTFSNAYTAGIGYPTDTLCTLTGTTNGTLARDVFAWIAAQKAATPTPTTTSTVATTTVVPTSTTSTTTTSTPVTTTTRRRKR